MATIRQVTTTTDEAGDTIAEAVVESEVPVLQFEPAQPTERTDPRSPGVVTPAKFYFAAPLYLNASDEIVENGVTWEVVGGSSVWGGTHTEVPVSRTA